MKGIVSMCSKEGRQALLTLVSSMCDEIVTADLTGLTRWPIEPHTLTLAVCSTVVGLACIFHFSSFCVEGAGGQGMTFVSMASFLAETELWEKL